MKAKYSLIEAKQKVEAFCAYQERCDQEVRKKLHSWQMDSEDVDILIADLISNNFLNEERFARSFVTGKFRIKKWGRIKIRQHLKQKQISEYSIKQGFSEIEENEYTEGLKQLAESKNRLISAKSKWDRMAKLQRFLNSKGYESDLIRDVVNELLNND